MSRARCHIQRREDLGLERLLLYGQRFGKGVGQMVIQVRSVRLACRVAKI